MRSSMPSPKPARSGLRRWLATAIATAAALALVVADASPAQAQMRLQFDNAAPGKYFQASGSPLRFRFEIAGQRERDVRVEAIHAPTGNMRKAWRINGVPPDTRVGVRWNTRLNNGSFAPAGRYRFRVREVGEGLAVRDRPNRVRLSMARTHRFPVRGNVSWGDGWGAGRGHRGQDLFAPCGRAILAARAGRVVWRAYQAGGAGHYVVIRGRQTNWDYVYMHLQPNVLVDEGDVVATGQRIGSNGATGNASGCHLHFELWTKQWFNGGRALTSVTKQLRRWYRWTNG